MKKYMQFMMSLAVCAIAALGFAGVLSAGAAEIGLEKARLHLDASTGPFELSVNGEMNQVDKWGDIRGGMTAVAGTPTQFQECVCKAKPVFVAEGLNGMPVVSCGDVFCHVKIKRKDHTDPLKFNKKSQ